MASNWYAIAGIVLVTYIFVNIVLPSFSAQARYLRSQPWVGQQKGWFASLKARIASVTKTRDMLLHGYDTYSSKNKLFVLPQLSTPANVVLPHSLVSEFLEKGSDEIDHHTLGAETLAFDYTIGKSFRGESHFDVVRRQLTRKLPLLTEDVYSELVLAMEQQWPATKDDWATVNVYPTCMKIVSRAANRVFSGQQLCRSDAYLEHSRLYAQSVFKCGGLLKLIPKFLHPIFAPILVRPVREHQAICSKLSIPIIENRLRQMEKLKGDYAPPVDVLQWVLDDALAAPADMSYRRNPEWISRFLLVLNMVAIHTTSIVISNTLMDVYTAPDRDDILAGLREEVQRVVGDGNWTKENINNLFRIDSCIRETMRFQALGDFGPRRLVKKEGGITLSGGVHIPKGVRVATPAFAIHRDEKVYDNANQWDGFRFSRPREEFMKRDSGAADRLEKILDLKNRSLVTTSDEFMSYGYGVHSCPGRFFASQEMKLMLAHIVMTYEVEIAGPRPDNMLINGASVPKDAFEMRIRLRS